MERGEGPPDSPPVTCRGFAYSLPPMPDFPPHIAKVLDDYGIRPETKSALFDLYLSMGPAVLEAFGEIAERTGDAADVTPEATLTIRNEVVERYLRRNHPLWLNGQPTASLWHPRVAEGRASGVVIPLGELSERVRSAVGGAERLPEGVLVLGRNAHLGGRQETVSFDLVERDFDDALLLAEAAGQQHTVPGSAGATSATLDSMRGVALIWEVQPHVYKPSGERNRGISRVFRRHRNWHIATLGAAIEWLIQHNAQLFVLRGEALAIAHEVNPGKPVSPEIAAMHDRTVSTVASALGLALHDATADDGFTLLDSCAMNHALRQHVLREGVEGLVWKCESEG